MVDRIRRALQDLLSGDDRLAEEAAAALIGLGPAAVEVLLPLAEDAGTETRWWALRTLAEIPDRRVPAVLCHALQDADAEVRQCAALGLRFQPDAAAIPALLAALDVDDRVLRHLAADALIALGKPAVTALLEAFGNGRQPVRRGAMRALAAIGDTRAVPVMFAALDDPSPLVAQFADEGLERMGIGMMFFKP